jgi:hypothetical protein
MSTAGLIFNFLSLPVISTEMGSKLLKTLQESGEHGLATDEESSGTDEIDKVPPSTMHLIELTILVTLLTKNLPKLQQSSAVLLVLLGSLCAFELDESLLITLKILSIFYFFDPGGLV